MTRLLRVPWAEALLRCASPHMEAPDRFVLWSAFSVLGGVLKDRVWIEDGTFKLYPNQYIVLVGPPGIGKGTAINFAWDVIRNGGPNFLVNMLSDRRTAEKIIMRIDTGWNSAPHVVGQQLVQGVTDHTCTLFSTELAVLLNASSWMLDFLCEGWDKRTYEYDTKHGGSSFLKDICVSLVAGTVPDFLRNIDRDANLSIKGGFTSRCLFIYEDRKARSLPFPPPLSKSPSSVALMGQLRNDLQHISQLAGGEMVYDTAARLRFQDFVKLINVDNDSDTDALLHFKSRARAHVLKLAMILTLSRKDSLVIEEIDMINAIAYIKDVLGTMERVFRGSGDSELASAAGRIQNYMEDKNKGQGMVSRVELLRNLHRHMTIETLDRCLYVLVEIGYCAPTTVGKASYYKLCNGHFAKGVPKKP